MDVHVDEWVSDTLKSFFLIFKNAYKNYIAIYKEKDQRRS